VDTDYVKVVGMTNVIREINIFFEKRLVCLDIMLVKTAYVAVHSILCIYICVFVELFRPF